ncbi:hypothetical protein ACWDA7_44145 [Streptomyces sp. NPDC001156]
MPRRQSRRTVADPLGLSSPLGRWGFGVLAGLALLTDQTLPFLVCAAIAAYAWKNR